MSTQKQTEANRRNAQRSTGPTTAEGKAKSSRNATTHGLTAAGFIVPEGREDALLQLTAGLREKLHPEGALQETLFDQIVKSSWKMTRCDLAETQLFLDNPDIDPILDDTNGPQLTRIQSYAKREESSMYRAMKKLGEIQTEVQFRKQMFPCDATTPENQAIHNVSEICNSRQILNAVTRLKKNKANSTKPAKPTQADYFAMLDAMTRPPRTNPASSEPASKPPAATPASEVAQNEAILARAAARRQAEAALMEEFKKVFSAPLPSRRNEANSQTAAAKPDMGLPAEHESAPGRGAK